MKNLIRTIGVLLIILLIAPDLKGQQEAYPGKYSKVQITIQDRSDIKYLQRAGLSLEGMKLEQHILSVILNQREIMKLKELGFPYEILIDDMTKYYQERNSRSKTEMENLEKQMKQKSSSGGFGFGSMGGYYTYNEIVAELDTMRMLYPDLITAKDSIGATLEGRTIWTAKISDNPDVNEDEPEVFYNALIHAREPEGMMAVIYFMYYLLENYGSDPEITYLVDNREFYFVPCINADGYEYNHQMAPNGGYMWRKNKLDNNGSGVFEEAYDGVDLNRNYGYMWGYSDIGSSPDPGSELYRGTEAFSELETQSIRDFCNSRNFDLAINFHTYADELLYPWEYTNIPTPDSNWYATYSPLMVIFNGYEYGQTPVILYELNGGANDWMYGEQSTKSKIFSFAIEVGNNNDGFWPEPERIFPLAEENVYLNKVLAWGPGVIDDPTYIIEADITPSAYLNEGDSVIVTALESNPQAYNSVVTAYVFNSADIIVDEFQLTETTTNNLAGYWTVPNEENIYKVLLKDSGIEIPSNFYYPEDSRFTTAGPVTLDSVLFIHQSGNYYFVRPFVTNQGSEFTITKAQIRFMCNDPWAVPADAVMNLQNLPPGVSATSLGTFTLRYIDSLLTDPVSFNLRFDIMFDGWTLWKDSTLMVVGITENNNPVPLEFSLEQNYPNPFNPETKIKYSITHASLVEVKVYDVLGNEIETLVNQKKPSGTYEIIWNAANLPSGVYFYQIRATPDDGQAGDFIQTKKMILLK